MRTRRAVLARPAVPVWILTAGCLLAGCGSSEPSVPTTVPASLPASASPAVVPAGDECPPQPPGTISWPEGVPGDLPKPPGATLTSSTTNPDGLVLVRFRTDTSVRQGIRHLVGTLQPAGYTLERGDAEAQEADAPFSKGTLRGIFRMIARETCQTDWLLAVTSAAPQDAAPAPLLPPPPGGVTPQPLPFG